MKNVAFALRVCAIKEEEQKQSILQSNKLINYDIIKNFYYCIPKLIVQNPISLTSTSYIIGVQLRLLLIFLYHEKTS